MPHERRRCPNRSAAMHPTPSHIQTALIVMSEPVIREATP
jgi:hypothetical protein